MQVASCQRNITYPGSLHGTNHAYGVAHFEDRVLEEWTLLLTALSSPYIQGNLSGNNPEN